jgi:hypothetical protein
MAEKKENKVLFNISGSRGGEDVELGLLGCGPSETSETTYECTWRHNPEDRVDTVSHGQSTCVRRGSRFNRQTMFYLAPTHRPVPPSKHRKF